MAEGAFSNASEFVRALIRPRQGAAGDACGLHRDVDVAIDQRERGEGLEGEDVFTELLEEGQQPHAMPA